MGIGIEKSDKFRFVEIIMFEYKMLMKGDCMKKIGLVGGTGPESTIMYYKKLNSDIDKLTEGKTMPDIAIESVNFRKHGIMFQITGMIY